MNTKRSTVFFVLMLAIGSALAASNAPIVMAMSGRGADSCATYLLALKDDKPTAGILMGGKSYSTEAAAITQWIVGFTNAIRWTLMQKVTLEGERVQDRGVATDVNAIALSVQNICQENPDQPVASAAITYVNSRVSRTK